MVHQTITTWHKMNEPSGDTDECEAGMKVLGGNRTVEGHSSVLNVMAALTCVNLSFTWEERLTGDTLNAKQACIIYMKWGPSLDQMPCTVIPLSKCPCSKY
ncbi:hypothetical protein Bbelb_363160 [Branchiostoma belcheri]|nr:hypothetical protein Bbelb_363160 [Branchiostoma belcheri]